jgi:hypothetical protein
MSKVKKKGNYPTKTLSDEQIKEIEFLSGNLNINQMADYFGIGRDTFFRLKRENPEIDRLYKKGRSKVIQGMANLIQDAARNGNVVAAMFYLKTQAGWRERTETEIDEDELDSRPQPLLVRFVGKEDLKEVKEITND